MSEQNTTTAVESNGSEKETRTPVQIVEYATREECEANRPAGAEKDTWKPYHLVNEKAGYDYWIWGVGSVNALAYDAKRSGTTASLGGTRGPRKATANSVLTDDAIKDIASLPEDMRERLLTSMNDENVRARVMAVVEASKPAGNGGHRKAGKPRALASH